MGNCDKTSSSMSLSIQYPFKTLQTTACVRQTEKVTRTHLFKITGYSLDKHIGKGEFLESTIFNVDGIDWSSQYYPNGCFAAQDDDISIFLCVKSKRKKLDCVKKVQCSFTIRDLSGCASPLSKTREITNFGKNTTKWGYLSFCKAKELETNIKGDCFEINCVVSVFKAFPVKSTPQIFSPPLNIRHTVEIISTSMLVLDTKNLSFWRILSHGLLSGGKGTCPIIWEVLKSKSGWEFFMNN